MPPRLGEAEARAVFRIFKCGSHGRVRHSLSRLRCRFSAIARQALGIQAANNEKARFANSPTLGNELMNAIIEALSAHSSLSKQALDSERVRAGLKDVLLGPAMLYEALRERHSGATVES